MDKNKASGVYGGKGDSLMNANLKIGELERERQHWLKEREWLLNRVSYCMVAINALGRHADLSAQEAKKVIDDFITEQEVKLGEQANTVKNKFMEDLKSGKMTEFKIVDRTTRDGK